jgi:N-acetylmuramoyl-L-alanine amidase
MAARAAEKENRADQTAGLDVMPEASAEIEPILDDLARRETRILSHLAAQESVRALERAGYVHKSPLRSAGFRVLRAGDLPSILIELGYLSNPEDVRALTDSEARASKARALATAILRLPLAPRATSALP